VGSGDDQKFIDYARDQGTYSRKFKKFCVVRAFKENAGRVEGDWTR
jgi:hypothetical protein